MPRQKLDSEEKLARRRIWEAEYRKHNRERLRANQRKYNLTEKSRERFKRYEQTEKAKRRTDRFNATPKAKARFKRYRKRHPDRVLETERRYRLANPEKVRLWKKNYYLKNREKLKAENQRRRMLNLPEIHSKEALKRAKRRADPKLREKDKLIKNAWYNRKWQSDPVFRLKANLRLRLRQAIKGRTKDQRALILLGCSLEEFKTYFESLFTEGMTWEHVFSGAIHIDHKLPISSFDLTNPEQVKKCFHFSNLQPLWALDNLKKSDTII